MASEPRANATLRAKDALRTALLAARRRRDPAERDRLGAAAAERLLAHPELQAARTVALYADLPGELPTDGLRAALLVRGVRVLLPVIGDGDVLSWRRLTRDDHLVPGRRGVRVPGADAVAATLAEADVVVAPGVAFDVRGRRLGRGGGAYDRALAEVRPGALVVGLCFDDEVVDRVPTREHDRAVHAVATPTRWLQTGVAR